MAWMPKVATAGARRQHYRENMLTGFDALAELYYAYWGEYFHLAVFEAGDDPADVAAAYQRTHERYLAAVGGPAARRILDVACGGGALSAWLADHTTAKVVGVDLSAGQLAHARRWLASGRRPNLRFVRHDVMQLGDLAEPPFDAAVCLDAACYLPDRRAALRQIAARLRPGGRLLLVDWCQAERPTAMQRELILEPLCRYWAIGELETAAGYRRSFAAAGLRIHRLDDLSERVVPNWERGYQAALRALAEPVRLGRLLRLAADTARHGSVVLQAAKDQFQVALLAKAAAESGLMRYVSVLAERTIEPYRTADGLRLPGGPTGAQCADAEYPAGMRTGRWRTRGAQAGCGGSSRCLLLRCRRRLNPVFTRRRHYTIARIWSVPCRGHKNKSSGTPAMPALPAQPRGCQAHPRPGQRLPWTGTLPGLPRRAAGASPRRCRVTIPPDLAVVPWQPDDRAADQR